MKGNPHRTRRALCVLLTVILLLPAGWERPAEAAELAGGVCATKRISAVSEAQRTFRLEYSVWSTDRVNRQQKPLGVLFLVDRSAPGLPGVLRGIASFAELLARSCPGSRIGIVPFGSKAEEAVWQPVEEEDPEAVLEILRGVKPEIVSRPDLAGALEQAEKAADRLDGDMSFCLVQVVSGLWAGDGKLPEKFRALEKAGKPSYILLLTDPKERESAFWREMSSRPLSSHYLVGGKQAEDCLERICRELGDIRPVTVVQELDPRFEPAPGEAERLRSEGAAVREAGGVWTASWEADLPRTEQSAWRAALTIRAREAFPGGNDVPTDGPNTGVYLSLKKEAALVAPRVNVPLRMEMRDLEAEIFLGEQVRVTVNGEKAEAAMCSLKNGDWCGMEPTGSVSLLWETAQGGAIGGWKQLETRTPRGDAAYRLKARFRPCSDGKDSVGTPVTAAEAVGTYLVKPVPGTVRIRVRAGEGASLAGTSGLRFLLVNQKGERYFCTAVPESDPETGEVFLAGEASGLPFGAYKVSPAARNVRCTESACTCLLGLCEENDTLSVRRNRAAVEFTAATE